MPDAYDASNIFARILRGEIPSHKIYEDIETLAIMDVMPQAKGHALVIPKLKSRNLLDAEPAALAAALAVAQKIANASIKQTHIHFLYPNIPQFLLPKNDKCSLNPLPLPLLKMRY